MPPARQPAACSIWSACCPPGQLLAADGGSGRRAEEERIEIADRCETEIFLSLAPDHRIAVRDHETGALWRGWADMTFPDHGFVWVITDFGERKLLDIGVRKIWRPDRGTFSEKLAMAPACAAAHTSARLNHAHLRRARSPRWWCGPSRSATT